MQDADWPTANDECTPRWKLMFEVDFCQFIGRQGAEHRLDKGKNCFAEPGSLPCRDVQVLPVYEYNVCDWYDHKIGEASIDVPAHVQCVTTPNADRVDARCKTLW